MEATINGKKRHELKVRASGCSFSAWLSKNLPRKQVKKIVLYDRQQEWRSDEKTIANFHNFDFGSI